MSQLSLVFFTVLAQSAVGMFIALGIINMRLSLNQTVITRSFMAVFALLGVGAIASVTHLGQPLRMFNVVFGLAHGSALSLEIVGLSLFGGAAASYTAMRLFNLFPSLQRLVLFAAMALGIVFILLIANVYTLETVPTWNTPFTAFQFLMTAFVVGPIAASASLHAQAKEMDDTLLKTDKLLAMLALSFGVLTLFAYALYLLWLGQLTLAFDPFSVVNHASALLLLRVGVLVAALIAWKVSTERHYANRLPVTASCFVFALIAEFTGRAFFYDVYISANAGM